MTRGFLRKKKNLKFSRKFYLLIGFFMLKLWRPARNVPHSCSGWFKKNILEKSYRKKSFRKKKFEI